LSWGIILTLMTAAVTATTLNTMGPGGEPAPGAAAPQEADWTILEIEAKLALAQEAMVPGSGAEVVATLDQGGGLDRQLRVSTVAAAVEGVDAGRSVLRGTGAMDPPNPEDHQAVRLDLDRLYAGDATEAMVARIHEELGWFGELAVAASTTDAAARRSALQPLVDPAIAMVLTMMIALGGVGLLGAAGLVGLIVLLVQARKGRLVKRFIVEFHQPEYVQTFAVWIIGFQLLLLLAGLVGGWLPGEWGMAPSLGAFAVSLAALVWPVCRGRSWQDVRREIGWTRGAGVLVETGWGVAGYAMALPIAGAGLLVTMLLIVLAAPAGGAASAAHPIVGELAAGTVIGRVQILLLAVVMAPLVEETMFRGVLYRQLRSASCRWATGWSILASVAASSLVFACIHPQGLLAVPALAALACAFALAREWRGSLIAAMVMHGISNGLVMTMLLLMLG